MRKELSINDGCTARPWSLEETDDTLDVPVDPFEIYEFLEEMPHREDPGNRTFWGPQDTAEMAGSQHDKYQAYLNRGFRCSTPVGVRWLRAQENEQWRGDNGR